MREANSMRRHGVVAILAVAMSCGPPRSQKAQSESCSDDHDEFWKAAPNVYIASAEEGAACNELQAYRRGGGQGGSVIHVEPELAIQTAAALPTVVTWQFYVPGAEDPRTEQSIEIWDGADDDFTIADEVFMTSADAGANRFVRATVEFEAQDGSTSTQTAEAAVYIPPTTMGRD